MQQEPNTVHMKLYTPSGVPLNFVISIRDGKLTETLPDVAAIDAMIAASGYLVTLPGLEPGEELETITHVILRIQHNKSDGTQTPCLGLFFENPKLVYCKKAYLNTPEDIATFERLSGLKLAQLPKFPGQFPKRDDLSAAEFIIAAKTPFQVRMTQGTYTDEATGEVKSTPKFAGFHDVSSKPATPPTTSTASGNGNAGSQGDKMITGNFAPPVLTWEEQVFEATAFLYDHPNHQTNSINALLANKIIKDTDKPVVSILQILFHNAGKKYGLSDAECKEIIGSQVEGSVADYMKKGGTIQKAWDVIVASQEKQENVLPPTGTEGANYQAPVDDIPF
jgi:hypothetical protein